MPLRSSKNSLYAGLLVKGWINDIALDNVGVSAIVLRPAAWTGNLYYPANAAATYIASENAGDTQEVYVYGLDDNGLEIREKVTLTGQTPKLLTNQFKRVNFIDFQTPGNVPAGNVWVSHDADFSAGVPVDADITLNMVAAGFIQSTALIYAVPSNAELYILEFIANIAANGGSIYVEKSFDNGSTWLEDDTLHVAADEREGWAYAVPHRIPGGTDLRITGDADSATTSIHASIGAHLDT